MELVNPGSAFTFTYPTFDQNAGLFISANVYDVSNGTPSLLTTVPMLVTALGVYSGTYTAVSGKTYLVISAVYTDDTYTTLDTSRPPEADCYQSTDAPRSFFAFNYGAYDQDASLFVAGSVFDLVSYVTIVQMTVVYAGVYFGSYVGTVNNAYVVAKAVYTDDTYTTVDSNRAPGADSFQFFATISPAKSFQSAVLTPQATTPQIPGRAILKFTQGDSLNLALLASLGPGILFDLTGAVFTTTFRGPTGLPISFPNSQHIANPDQVNHRGEYALVLSASDSASIPAGTNKEIVTKIVQGSSTIYFHGQGIGTILSSIPYQ